MVNSEQLFYVIFPLIAKVPYNTSLDSLTNISVGGGGTYGIWIDKDFSDGLIVSSILPDTFYRIIRRVHNLYEPSAKQHTYIQVFLCRSMGNPLKSETKQLPISHERL
jgi:hypothetical protein